MLWQESLRFCFINQMQKEFIQIVRLDRQIKKEIAKGEPALNRYFNVLPYSETMVPTKNNYFNGNYVGFDNYIIAAQAPTSAACQSFWEVVFEEQVSLIVTLCTCDKGKPGQKKQSERYWPRFQCYIQYKDYTVITVQDRRDMQYERREFLIEKKSTKSRLKCRQIQWLVWPDHGVPSKIHYQSLAEVIKEFEDNYLAKRRTLVHCSAGIGRTGTIISIVLSRLFNKSEKEVVTMLRTQRAGMVQTEEQYQFIREFNEWRQNIQ